MKILLLGDQCTGKTTILKFLEEKYKFSIILESSRILYSMIGNTCPMIPTTAEFESIYRVQREFEEFVINNSCKNIISEFDSKLSLFAWLYAKDKLDKIWENNIPSSIVDYSHIFFLESKNVELIHDNNRTVMDRTLREAEGLKYAEFCKNIQGIITIDSPIEYRIRDVCNILEI